MGDIQYGPHYSSHGGCQFAFHRPNKHPKRAAILVVTQFLKDLYIIFVNVDM